MESLLFEDLKLSREMKHAIKDMGFEEATPIQSLALPPILEGKDVIGQAQTGTGKTAAFGIPVLERLDSSNRGVQAVILCPTRELAIQVAEEIKKLSKYKKTSVSWAKEIPEHWNVMPNKYIMKKVKIICSIHKDEPILSLSMNSWN